MSINSKILETNKITYNNFAKSFSNTRKHNWPEFNLIKKYININNNTKILDIGCGNGRFLNFLNQTYKSKFIYHGIDPAEAFIEIAKKNTNNNMFTIGDFSNYNIMMIDYAIAIASFHHLPDKTNQINALEKTYKTLNNKGRLIFTVWNLNQIRFRYLRMIAIIKYLFSFGKYDYNNIKVKYGIEKCPRYYYRFTINSLTKLIKQTNFKIIDIKYTEKDKNIICILEK